MLSMGRVGTLPRQTKAMLARELWDSHVSLRLMKVVSSRAAADSSGFQGILRSNCLLFSRKNPAAVKCEPRWIDSKVNFYQQFNMRFSTSAPGSKSEGNRPQPALEEKVSADKVERKVEDNEWYSDPKACSMPR